MQCLNKMQAKEGSFEACTFKVTAVFTLQNL
jgi:hypothetical protein